MPIDVAEPTAEEAVLLPGGPPEIRIEQVSFEYLPGRPVLKAVDVELPAGRSVAIVGATGSGKSTLAKLLVRLADPTEGRILRHGIDPRHVPFPDLRSKVVLVPQETFLFDTTIAENVRFANPSAQPADIRLAFYELSLDDWLDALPAGVGARGGGGGGPLAGG